MAIARAGGIYVGINPRYVESEIAHIVNMTEPRLLLVETSFEDPGRVDRMNTAIAGTMISREVSSCVIAIHGLSDLSGSAGKILCSKSCQADIAVIVFTSGSTGKPKGAALHHGGLLAAALEQSRHVDGEPRRYLSNLPVNHVGGVMNLTLGCLVAGGTLIFQPKFDASEALELIASERISSWLQVPAMFTLATRHSDFANANLASVRSICIGGGAVSAPTLAALRTIGARIFVEYGQTEVMSTLSFSDEGASDEVLLNTVGKFSPQFETRIATYQNSVCEMGSVGEIQARGECVLRKYWAAPDATSAAFTIDGWLKTGDLALLREDENVVLQGRVPEMIKTGGYNVYPREVEQILEVHPAVAEAVVFGLPDDLYGERVCAAIELSVSALASSIVSSSKFIAREKSPTTKFPVNSGCARHCHDSRTENWIVTPLVGT